MLNAEMRAILDGPSLGHLSTVMPDGSPHSAPVYLGTRGERIVFFTGPRSRKARNLRRDPRLALSIAPVDNPFRPVIVRGGVVEWLDGDDAWDIVDALAVRYVGEPYPRDSPRTVAVVEPDHQIVGLG